MKLNDILTIMFVVFAIGVAFYCHSQSTLYASKCGEEVDAFVKGVSLMSYFEGLMTGLGGMLLLSEVLRFLERRKLKASGEKL